MALSIILVNYKSSGYLASCLASIKGSFNKNNYEIIVVDNSPMDGSCRLLQDKFPNILLIENIDNMGFARAVNQGSIRAKGKYLLVTNPDIIFSPGSIGKMLILMETHRDVGVLLPKLINPDGSLQFSCRTFYDFATILFRRTPLGKIFPDHRIIRQHLMMDWNHDELREVDWGLGACMMVRREALKGQKLFDERFFLYFEDVDLCYRMKEEGWKVVYYPGAVITHHHVRHSAISVLNRAKWEHFRSMIKFFLKHRRFRPATTQP
jgi:GT2 family glycosyltransferase